MMGAPSIKFYALLAIFGLGLVALRAKTANTSRGAVAGGTVP